MTAKAIGSTWIGCEATDESGMYTRVKISVTQDLHVTSIDKDSKSSEIFSLSGQRQAILKKGVNIVDGKKVIMK